MAIVLCSQVIAPLATHAASPTIATTISVYQDGTVPFSANTYNGTTYFGEDANNTNLVVRVLDLITYKVEVSCNDNVCITPTSVITLDSGDPTVRQEWFAIPDICTAASTISPNKKTLTCVIKNLHEGQNFVFYPVAKTTQLNNNGDIVRASVSTSSIGSNIAAAGPTSVTTTSSFGVDLIKTLRPPYQNNSGDIIYAPQVGVDVNGNAGGTGYIVTYRIDARYEIGSTYASGGANNLASYNLTDTFTFASGYLGTGALYAGCTVINSNGTITNCPTIGSSVFVGATPTTTIPLTITGINVLQATSQTSLFQIDMKYWIPITDIRTDGTPLTNSNYAYFNGGTIVDNNNQPLSHDNVPNYNGVSENTGNNGMSYPLFVTTPGAPYESFKSFWGKAGTSRNKLGAKKAAPGEVISYSINTSIYDVSPGIHTLISCDNLDTSQVEFVEDYNGTASYEAVPKIEKNTQIRQDLSIFLSQYKYTIYSIL